MAECSTSGDASRATPITVRVREACRLTGIGRSKLYELIAAGEIDTIKVGTITLVPLCGLVRFLERRRAPNLYDCCEPTGVTRR
jgi:excisionase family DNA binding protein